MKYVSLIVVLACIAVATAGCEHNERRKAEIRARLIEEGVQIKVTEFHTREWQRCLDNAQRQAIARVDSIIRARAREDAVQPIVKPPKPLRPEMPEVRALPDSVAKKRRVDDTARIHE